jgi:DNA-binding winged helix-turn-helix (wHTH) protein/tetratricopeptide (TPR) repeat protein
VRYAFDDFELDTEAYELLRGGKRVKVQPKVLQLIRYLVQNHGRFVSKEEILAALWPSEHVTESSLFVCVRAARIALGQSNAQNRPIATLRGAGYRFVGELSELAKPAPAARLRSSEPAGNRPAPAAPRDELVGRQNVMHALSNALGRATAGRGQIVILSGEAGIGKTRCAQELADLAARDRIRVFSARCLEVDGAPAFWPWVQLLRQAAAEGDPEWTAEARALLDELVPTGDARVGAQAETAEWANDRFWLFDRVVRMLAKVAEAAPCLFMLDDLQWADDASLRLLQLFVNDIGRVPCLVVATLREPRPAVNDAQERTLRRLARSAAVIELDGLSPAETAQLVSAVAGAASAARLASELHQKSAGNPFFLVELLRLAIASGSGDPAAPGATKLPRVVRDVIRGRLEVIDAKAQSVLRAASVFGGEFDLSLLLGVVELSRAALLAAIDAALASKLLTRAPGDGRFAFAHDLVREVVYDDLSQVERVRYHGRAGATLMARGSRDGHQTELAYHYHMALAGGGHEPALRYATAAGATALRTYAFDTAARCYHWALAALDHHPHDDPHARASLTLGLATAVLGLGRSTEAREIYKAAVAIADDHDFGDLLAAAGTWLRHNVATAPMPDPFSLRVLTRALELLRDDHPELKANVLSRLAWIWPNCEDMPRCKTLAAQSLALARTLRSDSTLLAALAATLYSLTGPEDVDALLATAEEVFGVEQRSGRLTWFSAEAHFLRYHAHLYRAQRSEADRALHEFGEVVGQLRMPEPILLYDRMCAQRIFDEGRLDEAEGLFAEQHARGQRLGLAYADLYYALQMLLVRWARSGLGDLPSVIAAEGWNISSTPVFRAMRLFIAAEMGRARDLAENWNALCQDDFAALPRDLNYLLALCLLSRVAIVLGDQPRARALYALLTPYARWSTPSLLSMTSGSVAHHLGTLAEFLGEPAHASAHFEAALIVNDRLGYVCWAARTRVSHAALLLAGGDETARTRARGLLDDALSAARKHGLGLVIAAAEPLLAQ